MISIVLSLYLILKNKSTLNYVLKCIYLFVIFFRSYLQLVAKADWTTTFLHVNLLYVPTDTFLLFLLFYSNWSQSNDMHIDRTMHGVNIYDFSTKKRKIIIKSGLSCSRIKTKTNEILCKKVIEFVIITTTIVICSKWKSKIIFHL